MTVRGLREGRICYRPRAEAHLAKKKIRKEIFLEGIECALEGQQTKIAIPCLVSNGGRGRLRANAGFVLHLKDLYVVAVVVVGC